MTSLLRCPFRCGSVVRARPRDDGYAFPGRRECWAHVESPPPPKKNIYSTASRFFEARRVVSQWRLRWFSAPLSGAILPEVEGYKIRGRHSQLTRSWKAPFTVRNKSWSSSPLTTLDGGAALGYMGIL